MNRNRLPLYSFQGQRQGSSIYHGGDGYFYHLNNDRRDRSFAYLRCMWYGRYGRNVSCPGSAKALLDEGWLFHLSGHNHERNFWFPGTVALRSAVINRLKRGEHASNAEILDEEGRRFPFQVRAEMPLAAIESGLNKIRAGLQPRIPDSLLQLGLRLMEPQYWHLTSCFGNQGSMFAGICGSEDDGTSSLVFISEDMKQFMRTRDVIFADGTERRKFRKPGNSQIFTISGVWGAHAVPMLRAIMLRRTEQAYVELFNFIKFLMPELQPSIIMCDFEDAEMNAFRTCFHGAEVMGCLWHYSVAVLRHAKYKLGLLPLLHEEEVVSSIIRASTAVPLLPTDEIRDGIYDLGEEADEMGWMPHLRPYFEYLEREWEPKIPILSVYNAAHRTNNVSESGNRALNKLLKVAHPGCYNVISAFTQLNERALIELEAIRNNKKVSRNRKISVLRNDAAIKRLCEELENGDITRLEFLHRASRRLQNVFMRVMNLARV